MILPLHFITKSKGTAVHMVDNWIAFTPENIAELNDQELLELLHWWKENGKRIYEEEHDRRNRGEPLPWPRPGVVYFARRSDGLIKIGFTTRSEERYKRLAEEQGERLEIVHEIKAMDPYELEQQLHREFGDFRQTGEWFNLPPYIQEEIKSR